MTQSLKPQLNLISNQINDIETAQRAITKAVRLANDEREALIGVQAEMKKLPSYALIKPSMDTALVNLDNKLKDLAALESETEDTLDKFYDLISSFTASHTSVLSKIKELEIVPTQPTIVDPKVEIHKPYAEPVKRTKDINLKEDIDFEEFSTPTDDETKALLDSIAPINAKDDVSLTETLGLTNTFEDDHGQPTKAAVDATDRTSLNDFGDIDAKLARV